MMLNAPRNSDHHAHPARPYPALRLPPGAPMLPCSVPVMGALALWPPVWRRVMDPRLPVRSRESDRHGAGAGPADLAG
jgi:alkane 1-monooxygenase